MHLGTFTSLCVVGSKRCGRQAACHIAFSQLFGTRPVRAKEKHALTERVKQVRLSLARYGGQSSGRGLADMSDNKRRFFNRPTRPAPVPAADGSVTVTVNGDVAGQFDVTFIGDNPGETDAKKASPTFEAFCMNAKNIDRGQLNALATPGHQVTMDELKSVLRDGATFQGKLPADGDPQTCSFCGQEGQGSIIPRIDRESGEPRADNGNFRVLKSDEVSQQNEEVKDRMAALTAKLASEAGQPAPTVMSLLFACPRCRQAEKVALNRAKRSGQDVTFPYYRSRAGALEVLFRVEQNITAKQARQDFFVSLNSKRRDNGNQRGNGGRNQRGNGRRQEYTQVDFYGARLRDYQAEALVEAGIDSLEAAAELSLQRLAEIGAARDERDANGLHNWIVGAIDRRDRREREIGQVGGYSLSEVSFEGLSGLDLKGDTSKKDKGRRKPAGETRKREGRPVKRSSQSSLNEE